MPFFALLLGAKMFCSSRMSTYTDTDPRLARNAGSREMSVPVVASSGVLLALTGGRQGDIGSLPRCAAYGRTARVLRRLVDLASISMHAWCPAAVRRARSHKLHTSPFTNCVPSRSDCGCYGITYQVHHGHGVIIAQVVV